MMTTVHGCGRGRLGAYGLRIEGLSEAERLLVKAEPSWPGVEISVRRGPTDGFHERVDARGATILLLGAVALVRRSPGRAELVFEDEPSIEAIVHPYLAPIAGLLSHWHGRESIHAGAFLVDGGAWGVLSERGGGKSSTLARLALDGIPIVSDDVVVLEGETAFAGPRAIDLRREPAEALGVGEPLGVVGARERWRFATGEIPGSVPLRGWVFLSWGDTLSMKPVPAGERFERLVQARTIRLTPQDPTDLLRLAARPGFELRRPRSWSSLRAAVDLLRETLSRAA